MAETATLPHVGTAGKARPDAAPLQVRSLREQVYDFLRAEMARGGLPPGVLAGGVEHATQEGRLVDPRVSRMSRETVVSTMASRM